MKRMVLLALLCLLLNGCSALPAEERAFAVALGVSVEEGVWQASARVPVYKSDGGYVTLTAEGASLRAALANLDAASPMRLHYGQVRLLVFGQELAASDHFAGALKALSDRTDMRMQAEVCVTGDSVVQLLDALEPQTGMRLSKSLDVLLETRRELGVIPEATLSDVMRMGERQQPVLLAAGLEAAKNAESKANVQFSGGYLTDSRGCARVEASAEDVQLLNLLTGRLKKSAVQLGDRVVMLSGASVSVKLNDGRVSGRLRLKTEATVQEAESIRQQVHQAVIALRDKLAFAGCDALGLGRQAIRGCVDLPAWRGLNWPEVYPQLTWEITVELQLPA